VSRWRGLAALGALGTVVLAGGPAVVGAQVAAPAAAPEAAGVELLVQVSNLRNDKGTVRACMTDDPKRFPRCRDDAQSYRLVVPAAEAQVLRFRNVRPGTYAIALLHDENDNGRADRALSMIPREGFGFSRDAKVSLGPPDFEDASITLGARPQEQQAIRMRYML
jgi:uncharacterized protein (DUF2141 family)